MLIEVTELTHVYLRGSPLEVTALRGVDLQVAEGEFLGLIGPTGSGKSTLAQHLNGLLRPTSGRVVVEGEDISAKRKPLRSLRQKVGLVFQYPEHQLFEETVYDDVAFGPRNLGLDEAEVKRRVHWATSLVGLPEEMLSRSPFELSGGQMRRVAIAGVLAMRPRVLVLDEPAAGLDPRGRRDILGHIRKMHQKEGITVILVSHNMEDVAELAQRIVVLHRGEVFLQGPTRKVFGQAERLRGIGLDIPPVTALMHQLRHRGLPVRADVLTVEEAEQEIVNHWRQRRPC